MLYSFYAYGEFNPLDDHSTPDPLNILLSNKDIKRIYLIELYPYDENKSQSMDDGLPYATTAYGEFGFAYTGAISPVYFSSNGFKTEPSDNPSSKYFIAQVDNPFQFETAIFSGDGFSGGNNSFGAINILNGNGELDFLQKFYWSDRRVVVKVGGEGFRYADFSIVFDGVANDIEADDDSITITIKDNRARTDQPIQPGSYSGIGGLDGGDDLANKPKPLAFGRLFNIEPILVDAFNLIYQFHAGSALSVDELRDSGVPLTYDGDFLNINAVTPAAGHYASQLSRGFVKIGSIPAGRITADVHGDNVGGYVSAVPDIINRIVSTYLGISSLSPGEIDLGSLARLKIAIPGEAGIYMAETTTASNVIDELIYSIGAYWNFSRQGQLFVGIVTPPTIAASFFNGNNIDEEGVKITADIAPSWRISVGYAPSWTIQSADELAGATSDDQRSFVSQSYRYLTFEDSGIRAINKAAVERQFNTVLANQADAQALLDRLVAIYSKRRKVYEFIAYKNLFRVFIGDTANLQYDRHGLDAGANLLTVGIGEDAETEQTSLRLWG